VQGRAVDAARAACGVLSTHDPQHALLGAATARASRAVQVYRHNFPRGRPRVCSNCGGCGTKLPGRRCPSSGFVHHTATLSQVVSATLLFKKMTKHHDGREELCSAPGLFNAKQRYPIYRAPCGPLNHKYLDITKGRIGQKSYCGSSNWRCKPYPRVCCNQVVGIIPAAGPHPPGKAYVGVCNGQNATRFRGSRTSIMCSDPCPPGQCRPKPEDCPCCPKCWYKITDGRVAPACRGVKCGGKHRRGRKHQAGCCRG